MEGLKDVRNLVRRGDFLLKLDLKDAFWSIPVNRQSRKLMRFMWEGTLYEFNTLAFGLGPAPYVFTKLLKVPISLARRLGIMLVIYLDDMLIRAGSMSEALEARDTLIFLLENLGFTINWEKSILQPTHRLEFLGMEVDTLEMTITLPEKKVQAIILLCQQRLTQETLSLREMSQLIGKLYSTSPAILQAPLQIRALQQDLIRALSGGSTYSDHLTLSQDSRMELKWWTFNLRLQKGNPIHLQEPEMIIFSDAAGTGGWGAAMEGGPSTGGLWSLEEKETLHINTLELLAAELAIKTFVRVNPVPSIHIWIDNQVALSYLVKMGGTKNESLTAISKRIWTFLLNKGITLTAGWIPSKQNWRADLESRRSQNSGDWMLLPSLFDTLCRRWGTPSVDCFASRLMHQLPSYFSLDVDPECLAQNALYQPWHKEFPYVFPPFCLIGRCLKKLNQEGVPQALFVAPLWTGQPWFPLLLEMCVDHPVWLPNLHNLLQDSNEQPHPLIVGQTLKLGAFMVTGVSSRQKEYRRGLKNFSWNQGGRPPICCTPTIGKNGVLGVSKGKQIPFLTL